MPIAAILFFLAFLTNGGFINVHSAWFDTMGLVTLGLFFLAWPWWGSWPSWRAPWKK